ncbi:MAG: 2-oxoglutarate dehydrogenase E1 component [SAR324 cluster bacterium]|nr:2-oxoglutarate dehydrogenase E1 component [SAR324 cluster bacterium]
MDNYSYMSNADVTVIEDMYRQYQADPASVDTSWQQFFKGFDFSREQYAEESEGDCPAALKGEQEASSKFKKEVAVINLIGAYRQRGHLYSTTNPVRPRRQHMAPMQLNDFGLSDTDLSTVFQAGIQIGLENATLQEILEHLKQTYCGNIGAEFVYMRPREAAEWLQKKMEACRNTPNFSVEEKKRILHKLNQAVIFENFLHTKFVGQKRFSLEGSETIIPALDAIVEKGADLGIEEFVIGMAHRGRLNVLANILDKTYETIFAEFEGKAFEESIFEGDVKYHLGFSSNKHTEHGKKVHLTLTPNPSHLEAVNPVVEGIVRAKSDFRYNGDLNKIAPILIHGDASIAGQGIIYEVLQMSTLEGYKTGGTIHVILNNQVGFTTNYIDARSSTYCTDVAKTTLSPIFHINGDDAEAVTYVIQLALEYRQQFHKDVFIDILGYRKHGHNESDEPRFTQPILYNIIAKHPNPREIYSQQLIEHGSIEANLAKEMEQQFKKELQERLDEARQKEAAELPSFLDGVWKGIRMSSPEDFIQSPPTGIEEQTLKAVANTIASVPTDMKFFPKLKKLFEARGKMVNETHKIDWGMGELLAYGSLLNEQVPIRISGQDVERGTFSHRHAVAKLPDSEEEYIPLEHISENQGPFRIYNSLLSEYAVLGFEVGYSMTTPHALVIWEAQFGDFANGAQIIIDQFIAASETKWQRMSGLVLSLPHGFEGQGPEHSSARLERFLELCGEYNMQVVSCTTPANLFHVLRRQIKRPFRKPLILMSPKSLLRHPLCVSTPEDFMTGTQFLEVIDDSYVDSQSVKRILFCSGKIYYDLLGRQQIEKHQDIAIIRVEQLYPIPTTQLEAIIKKYNNAKEHFWVQEEPENMGAWPFLLRKFKIVPLHGITRKESASPATGFAKMHQTQQQNLLDKSFASS